MTPLYYYPSNPTIQFLSLTGLRNNYNILHTALPIVMDFLSKDYKSTVNNIGLVRNLTHNSNTPFISNLFSLNRSKLLPFINIDNTNLDNTNLDNTNLDNNIPILMFTNKIWSEQYNLNRIILLSLRFMPFIDVSKFIRLKNYKKKVMIYFISLNEFNKDRGRLIQVTKRSKAFPLQIVGAKNYIKKLYPISCFATLSGSISNDNKVEVLYDNHLLLSSFNKIKNIIVRTVNTLFTLLVNSTQPQNIIFGDSLSVKTNSKKNSITYLSNINKTVFNYLTPPSNLIINDERFIYNLYKNPIIFKYFL